MVVFKLIKNNCVLFEELSMFDVWEVLEKVSFWLICLVGVNVSLFNEIDLVFWEFVKNYDL